MDEEIQKPEPKISDVEIVLVGLFYVVLDLIDLIPIAGDITDVVAAPMIFYYWAKGISGTTFIVAEILDAIPVLQEAPSRTIGWGIAVWVDRHPKLEAALEIAAALEGEVESVEGEAAAENVAARETAELQSNTLEMTQNADGTWERQSSPEAAESDAKPSEKTAERGGDNQNNNDRGNENEAGKPSEEPQRLEIDRGDQAEEQGEETEEESRARRQREQAEEYEKLMRSDAETPPIEEAEKEDFAETPSFLQQKSGKENAPAQFDPRLNEKNRAASNNLVLERQKRNQEKARQTENVREPQIKEVNSGDKPGTSTGTNTSPANKDTDDDVRRAA